MAAEHGWHQDSSHEAKAHRGPPQSSDLRAQAWISNRITTAKLIKRMLLARWSMAQVHSGLSDPTNLGGAYYRWRCTYGGDDSYLTHMVENQDHPYSPTPYCVFGPRTQ